MEGWDLAEYHRFIQSQKPHQPKNWADFFFFTFLSFKNVKKKHLFISSQSTFLLKGKK